MYNSPLRYPGGKNKLSAFLAKICIDNDINGHYVEPYAGGAAVALFLLYENFVNQITINDKDRSIYAFWYSVLNHNSEFCERIIEAEVSLENWHMQKNIQQDKFNANLLDLGFSTFFLNRTNRSGIINGGIIGGLDQSGEYKMDCRFNKPKLLKRIRKISDYKDSINLFNLDALELVKRIRREEEADNTIFYFDPPYYLKASSLYLNHYEDDDHQKVSDEIQKISNIKWIVSYDNVAEILELYKDCKKKEYSFYHNAYKSRIGKEVLFFSDNLDLPKEEGWDPLSFKKRRLNDGMKIYYKE